MQRMKLVKMSTVRQGTLSIIYVQEGQMYSTFLLYMSLCTGGVYRRRDGGHVITLYLLA